MFKKIIKTATMAVAKKSNASGKALGSFPNAFKPTRTTPLLRTHESAAAATVNSSNQVPVFVSRLAALKHTFEQNQGSDNSFFSKDMGTVSRQYIRWENNLPEIRPFYALKCNPDPVILQTLACQGAGFDCATSAEIDLALSTGVSPEDVIFANPVKSAADIGFARSKSVKKMTFDNIDELRKIHKLFPEAELVLRLLPDDSGSLMRFGSKFGADEEIVPDLLSAALAMNVKVIGVSFHIGSGCYEPSLYDDALLMCKRVFDKAAEIGLPPMTFLDIGGGFPGAPENAPGDQLPFEKFASVIRVAMEKYFPSDKYPEVQKIGEPGRYFASHCGVLFSRVVGKRAQRTTAEDQQDKRVLYYMNDGVYGSFNCIFFDHYNPIPIPVSELFQPQQQAEEAATIRVHAPRTTMLPSPAAPQQHAMSGMATLAPRTLGTFFGPTCDSLDKICEDHPTPELSVGDWVAFENMGAYTSAAASTFNGVPLAKVYHCHTLSSQ